eukprot:TRINITY_DN7852_c0_g1_i2.p1 TRINITY_DN7852_c0_g1~~TRINITY_DN7852_c0_g1_i2.p1  ORF type:complete len:238 (+),score=61.73 TRINITY_DN7852_c0_g1_i2:2-715(+)
MTAEGKFPAWLLSELQKHDADDEALADYILSILADEHTSEEEAKEMTVDMLSAVIEDIAILGALVDTIFAKWSSARLSNPQEVHEPDASALLEDIAAAHNAKLKEADNKVKAEREAKQAALDEAAKQLTIAQGNIPLSDEEDQAEDAVEEAPKTRPLTARKEKRQRKQATAAELAMEFENSNRARVDQAVLSKQQAQREASKSKAARDKADLAADKARKADAKNARRQKAQKGERRR